MIQSHDLQHGLHTDDFMRGITLYATNIICGHQKINGPISFKERDNLAGKVWEPGVRSCNRTNTWSLWDETRSFFVSTTCRSHTVNYVWSMRFRLLGERVAGRGDNENDPLYRVYRAHVRRDALPVDFSNHEFGDPGIWTEATMELWSPRFSIINIFMTNYFL